MVCELLRHSYNCNICKIKREIKRMSLLDLGSDECHLNFMNFKIDSFEIRKNS